MTVTITLPQNIETQLKRKAKTLQLSIEEMELEILGNALTIEPVFSSPEDVVAKIQALSSNSKNLRPASGSLAEALRQAPVDPDFDLKRWEREWADAEAEMGQITKSNTLAEGRELHRCSWHFYRH